MSDTAPFSGEQVIEAIRVRFEKACMANEKPAIEEYLTEVAEEVRPALLSELLALEFSYRRRAGEWPTVDDYAARFPEMAARLQELFDRLPTPLPPTFVETKAIGPAPVGMESRKRYQPVKLHAEGGLGEVHLATDQELGRQVALKRIKGSRADDADSRWRFVREAEVTGRLEHPGVVPVYGLVQDDLGQPCYAMRFIEGETLRDAIRRYHASGEPRLALRELLGRFVAVCNTMAYAHARGVIHRDLKPANVMLGKYGETLVVDWGLAKVLQDAESTPETGSAEEKNVPETMQGQVAGTPAYVSPEQANGEWDRVGPASDVFCLGATLYEILTNQVPYKGADALEAVDKARRGEFPHPRQLKREVPRALEAVCLKAMAKKPEERYAEAKELAEDVERWLADEPVSVYRGTITERLGRWARRHRTAVVAGLAVGVAALVGVGLLAWQSERGRKQLQGEQAATEQARREAEENARRERKAIHDYFVRATEDPAWKAAGLQPLRRKLLEEARTYFQRFVRERAEDPELLEELADAHARLFVLIRELGDRPQAKAEGEAALALYARLAAEQPQSPRFLEKQAKTRNNLGTALYEMGRFDEAQKAFQEALQAFEQLNAASPNNPAYLQDLSILHGSLSELKKDLGDGPGARDEAEKSLAIMIRLVKENPEAPNYVTDLARCYSNLGVRLRKFFGDLPGARKAYERSIELLEPLVAKYPNEPEYRWDLGMAYNNLSVVLGRQGDRPAARKAQERSMEQHRWLVDHHPEVPEYRRDLAMNHFNLCNDRWEEGDFEGARREIREAIALRERLVARYPAVPHYQEELARCYQRHGDVLIRLEDWPTAQEEMKKALKLRQELVQKNSQRPEFRHQLASSYNSYGIFLRNRSDKGGARQTYQEAVALSKQLTKEQPGILDYAEQLASTYFNLGKLEQEEQPLLALDWLTQAADALDNDSLRDRLDVGARQILGNVYHFRGVTLGQLKRYPEAIKDFDRAFGLKDDLNRPLVRLDRGLTLARMGDHARAADDVEGFVKTGGKLPGQFFVGAARINAVSAGKLLENDATDPPDAKERKELAAKYVDRALDILKLAVQRGYQDAERLKTDKGLEPLRSRPEFQKLLQEIETRRKATSPPAGSKKS
jgi:serine/threonine-protein kinase